MGSSIQQTIAANSPAVAGTVIHGVVFENLDRTDQVKMLATVQGATGGTLNIYIQGYDGTQWFDIASLPQLADGVAVRTYSIKFDRKTLPMDLAANIVTVGVGDTPVLAAGGVDPSDFSDRLRIVFVAGIGTSAAAAQSFSAFSFTTDLEDLELQDVTARGMRIGLD